MSTAHNNYTAKHCEKLALAIAYLRQRKIYILEFPFLPTDSANTSVRDTWERYRAAQSKLRAVKLEAA